MSLFACWTATSALWSEPSAVSSQALRVIALLSGLAAAVTLLPRARLEFFVAVLLAGVAAIACYSLATRLLPDHLGQALDVTAGNRLTRPVGYWNSLGAYMAIGILMAVGLAGSRRRAIRMSAASAVPLLSTTLYFTFSRGAILALAAGLIAIFASNPSRAGWIVRTTGLALVAGWCILIGSRSHTLTAQKATVAATRHDGHKLAFLVALSMLAAAGLGAMSGRSPGRLAARAVTALAAAAIGVALISATVVLGGPVGIAKKFAAPPPPTNGHLNSRLFSFSGSYRAPLWHVAWQEYKAHPTLGGGADSYERYYLQHRTRPDKVKNAHNLYLETLAELGPIGLALLLAALLTPLYAAVKARRHPLGPALAGAYVAFVVHVSVDWDWQMTAVSLTGLFCGAAILVAARRDEDEQREMSSRGRYVLLGAVIVVMVLAFVGLVGNMSLSRASAAAGKGDWATSVKDARRAHTWAPWSSEPYRLLGEAELGQGDTKAAIASFNKALGKSPDDWNVWFDLARATTGRPQQQALAQATRLNPLSPEIAELRREVAAEKVITVVPN
jgi:O-antigen ligase